MKTKMRFYIPDPCTEDWSKMPETEKGKFCAKCEKEVFDFSRLSDAEIQMKFSGFYASRIEVCGQFSNHQLTPPSGFETKTTPLGIFAGFKQFTYPFFIAIASWFFSSCKTGRRTSGVVNWRQDGGRVNHLKNFNNLCSLPERTAGSIVIDDHDTIRADSSSLNKQLFCKVNFDNDDFKLTDISKRTIDKFIQELNKIEYSSVEIIGHTDTIGSMQYNKILSEKRAREVQSMLVNSGIRVTLVRGVGFQYPISSNVSMAGRADNRRVEIKVQQKK